MAEAMLLGKPVIATRYSGNLDFMDDANSLLVDYQLVPVGKSRRMILTGIGLSRRWVASAGIEPRA